jgi:glycosyltransferase involved in cell wall biosynthesis
MQPALTSNKKPTRILLLTRYSRSGASSRQRFLLFSDHLLANGFNLQVEPLFSESYLSRLYARQPKNWLDILWRYLRRVRLISRSPADEIVWIEKEALPWLPAWLEHLLLSGRTYVIDFDDAWHLKYEESASWRYFNPMSAKLASLARDARSVTVANRELMTWASSVGCHEVIMIPTVVDTAHYPLLPEPDFPFTIGWIGIPLNAPYLLSVLEPLRRLSQEGARLKVIGSMHGVDLPGVTLDVVPWSEQTEAAELSGCHVGIMPLTDRPWERHKSGYKLIQYMAAGRSVVAHPVGANLDIVLDGATGFLARSEADWYEALAKLRNDPTLRHRLGAAGRRRCEVYYSLDAVKDLVVEPFRNVRDNRTAPLKFKREIH